MKWCSWQFVSHSISFVISQANASLGLVSGAPLVGPKRASIGWVGFLSGSAGAFAGTDGAGSGAISGICRCENLGSLNRILPIFSLHVWIRLGRVRTHSIVSLSRPFRKDRFCNTLRTASSKRNIAARCSHGSARIRVDRIEVEECRVGDRNPSVRLRIGRRRTEGNQEQEQPSASGGVRSTGTSSLAGKHSLSLGRGLDFCHSALSWQDSIHLSNSLPTTHSSRYRESCWNKQQQGSTDRMAHTTPITSDLADLNRGKCEGRAVTASSYNPKDYLGTLRTSRFSRSAERTQQGRSDGASGRIPGETEGADGYRNGVETRAPLALGVRGCPNSTLSKAAKYFEILVSAAGLEPATHALKGSPTQLQTITCTSSLLHARHNKINEMPTRHRSGCPEGARNPASRTMSLRFIGSFVTRRIRFAEPSSIRLFSGLAYFVV